MRRFSVTTVLLGLQRVGIVGLREAIDEVEQRQPADHHEATDQLLRILARRNHIPPGDDGAYRRAILREWLRHRGEPLDGCFAEIEVTVESEPGEARQGFVGMLESVLAALELAPIVRHVEPAPGSVTPRLLIRGKTVAYGPQSRESLKAAVQRSISDW